ncbi:cell division cycle-associated protein 3 [Conger conger]|uniref:cell division cycle-associated protein 3 n=1 Tax=Conger conger TaxID=82655 RepID=UPI002A5A25C4|nr:cell division cycle-associated protein 3 [Conger conger]XP_061092231.1 cell division cycle-associated protein 3 [Conger conger]
MGASESKIAVETPKPDRNLGRQIRNDRLSRLVDPRSPSTGIDRTPIQVGDTAARGSVEVECEGPALTGDPRSPSPDISRTPMKDVMRATVHSFARRLGMLFLNEGGDRVAPLPPMKLSEVHSLSLEEEGGMDSVKPFLPPHPSSDSDALAPGVCIPPAPACPAHQARDGEAASAHSAASQAEDEGPEGGEVDGSLESEEATTDDDLPLNKELSLSLLACHDGEASSDVSDDASRPHSPLPDIEPCGYLDQEVCPSPTPAPLDPEACLSPTPAPLDPEACLSSTPAPLDPEVCPSPTPAPLDPEACLSPTPAPLDPEACLSSTPAPLDPEACPSPTPDSVPPSSAEVSLTTSPTCGDVAEPQSDSADSPAKLESGAEESPKPAAADPAPSRNENPRAQAGWDHMGVKLPTFSTKSPSQVVFKPQWLGVGFGVTGVRARGVQGKAKGSSSPLSVRVGGRKAGNENRGPVAKQKQRERCAKALASEGRSPLQILKANSPLEHSSQMKLKISTPDRQRLGQVDRRALTLSLNKENQR